ncbi:mCG1028585 [Mus musculus]|nr:mCG1028585 [Mus musculus]
MERIIQCLWITRGCLSSNFTINLLFYLQHNLTHISKDEN